ncbi:MAG: hypothetical protein ACRDBL_08085 [Rhabdaerophilum sp.]
MKLLPQFRDNRYEYWAQLKAQEAHFARLRAALPVVEIHEPMPEAERQFLLEWKYRADQPRVPSGNPRGGQWTRDGDGGDDEAEAGEATEGNDIGSASGDSGFYESDQDYSSSSDAGDESFREGRLSSDNRVGGDAGENPDRSPYGEAPDGTPVEGVYDRGTNTRAREHFLAPDGQPVLNRNGNPMMIASDHPPEYFVRKGEEARADIEIAMRLEQPGTALERLLKDLYNFRHGGEWDLQRTPGIFDEALRDYSTVAIGLYASAAGLSESTILELQNQFARFRSRFSRSEEMDEYYR